MTLHVLAQLPLWVEGDLAQEEMASIDQHLAQCPNCREAAEALRASQAWLREASTPPFAATDHERLRSAVINQLRNQPQPARPLLRRPALLAAVAASLLLASLTWLQQKPNTVPQPLLGPTPHIPPEATHQEAPPQLARRQPSRAAPTHRAKAPEERADEPDPPASQALTRIEFQTADPNIRIIWLAQAKPLPETALPTQEEP